jgi:uncharacterized membrane protein
MVMLIAGLILFFAPHSISIVAPHWRNRMALHLGEPLWKGMYSLIATAALALIVLGFMAARRAPVVLYVSPAWLRYLTLVLMLPVFPLLLAAYLPGRILATVKHPMLTAVKLWATAHLLVNGMLADVLLFGSFLLWAGIDRASLKRRIQAPIRRAPPRPYNDLLALGIGLALYALFVWRLHALIIGVPVLPSL